jgi:hypothetical protein
MYTFTNKLRNFSIVFMMVGFLGLVYGFLSMPSTIKDAQAMVAEVHHSDEDHQEAAHRADHVTDVDQKKH